VSGEYARVVQTWQVLSDAGAFMIG
jgi:hypothetical protein